MFCLRKTHENHSLPGLPPTYTSMYLIEVEPNEDVYLKKIHSAEQAMTWETREEAQIEIDKLKMIYKNLRGKRQKERLLPYLIGWSIQLHSEEIRRTEAKKAKK